MAGLKGTRRARVRRERSGGCHCRRRQWQWWWSRVQGTFELSRIFALFTIGLSSQRLRERIAEETYPEHPETYWGSKFPPWIRAMLVLWIQVGCGLVRSSRTRRDHSNKEKDLMMSNYDKIGRYICGQWLTLQFIEIHK